MVDGEKYEEYIIQPPTKAGDVKTGEWMYWSSKGVPEKKETYNKKGELNGPAETYNLNGKLESKGNYKNGKPDGKWEYYFPHGSRMRICEYEEGRLNGKSIVYNERGQIIEESNYKNNKLHGLYTSFDERTGKVLLKQEYENGRVVKVLEGKPGK